MILYIIICQSTFCDSNFIQNFFFSGTDLDWQKPGSFQKFTPQVSGNETDLHVADKDSVIESAGGMIETYKIIPALF